MQKYKQYSNLLNQLKTKSKNDYYNQHFQLYQSNLKETWKLIGTLIKRKTKGQPNSPTRLMINQGRRKLFSIGGGLKARAEGPRKFLNLESLKCHFLDFGGRFDRILIVKKQRFSMSKFTGKYGPDCKVLLLRGGNFSS